MNKTIKKWLICLTVLALLPVTSIKADNLTPIKRIEWKGSNSEASTEEPSMDLEETMEAEESPEGEQERTDSAEELSTDQISHESPLEFVKTLSRVKQRSLEYVSFAKGEETMSLLSHTLHKDGDRYFIAQVYPPFLPYTQYVESDRQSIQQAYLSIDELKAYAADALEQQPQIYQESPVAQLHDFFQQNEAAPDLSDKCLVIDPQNSRLGPIVMDMFTIETFLMDVIEEWLAYDSVNEAFMETELGIQVDIHGANGELFNQIAQERMSNYPGIESFMEQFSQGIAGTLMINYDKNLLGLGLIAEATDELVTGSEIYLEASEDALPPFTADQLMTTDQFNELVGFDVLKEVNEFEASLTADQFVPVEESGE